MADKSLNKSELVAKIAAATNQSQSTFDALSEAVGSDTKVSIPGWLAVERTHRAARTGRNPQTGETIQIAAGNSVKVTAGSKLKAAAK